jgi:hypothetical protein
MNKKTYTFIGTTGTIPNVPGEFPAGVSVDIDLDTNTVLETRLLNAPPPAVSPLQAEGEPVEQPSETAPESPSESEPSAPLVEQTPPETAPSSTPETQEPSSALVDEQSTQQGG